MKQYTFVLNFGYAEDAALSFFPFTSYTKHSSSKKALIDLATFLKDAFSARNRGSTEPCCVALKKKHPIAKFCYECGRLIDKEEFDGEAFIDWLRDLNNCGSIDELHSSFIDYDETSPWQSDGLENQPNPIFVYEAEWVLAAAVGWPDNKAFEKIKNTKNSFSFY